MRVRRLPSLFWLGAGVYVVLTILVAIHAFAGLDLTIYHLGTRHRHPSLYAAANHLTNVFNPVSDTAFLAVGAGALAWRRRRPAIFVAATLSEGTMAVIVLLTKSALGRPLPHTRPGGHADAFPSGHTAAFLVCFGTLALLATTRHRYYRPALLCLVSLGTFFVGASLVYDGFHWLTDTIASASLGISVLTAFAVAIRPDP